MPEDTQTRSESGSPNNSAPETLAEAAKAVPAALVDLKKSISKEASRLAKTQQSIDLLHEKARVAAERAITLAEEAIPKLDKSIASGNEVARLLEESRIILGKLQAGAEETSKAQAQVAALAERVRADADDVSNQRSRTTATADDVDENGKTIAERSRHIEGSRKHADEVRTHIDNVLTDSKAQAARIEGVWNEAQDVLDRIRLELDQARDVRSAVEDERHASHAARQELETLLKDAHEATENAKASVTSAQEVEIKNNAALKQLAEQESRLSALGKEFEDIRLRIEALLPGATSASLATEFYKRAEEHEPLKNRWQWVFLGSLFAIFVIAIVEVYLHGNAHDTPAYDDLFRRFLNRLPIITPLAIAAWYSAIRSAQARQLEEEYAFKAATAASFDGFAKMMEDVPAGKDGETALGTLAANVLRILSASPQRIFHRDQSKEMPTGKLIGDVAGFPVEVIERLRAPARSDKGAGDLESPKA